MIECVVRIDYNIEAIAKGKFANLAVELDLEKLICLQFHLDGKLQHVEYEGFPKICFSCADMAM